jgi:hypothetical protein
VSLSLTTREHLRARQADANLASEAFDFVQEGSLATFWRQATPGTTYWRGYLPMLYLPGQVAQLQNDSLSMEGDELILHGHEGVAIWQFLGDDGRSRIVKQMQKQGVRTVMEIDDNYLRYAPPLYGKFGAWTKTHAEAVANGTGYSVEMHRKIVPMMDALIVSTENLADEYDRWNDNIYVCPNSVDPTDWKVERIPSDTLRIGYYGSPSHIRDWPVVKKALKWAQRQPDVEVVLAGFSPPGWTGRVLPWSDNLFDARSALGHMDVGIAPLTVNPWSAGKSDVKALEYAMAGALPILHDAAPYDPWHDIGWDWMCSTESDWMEAIQHAVRMGKDAVALEAAKAKEYVLTERTIQTSIHNWRDAIDGS